MSNLIPFGGNGSLANPSQLAAALQNVSRESAPNGLFLRMGKDGVWIVGIEMEPVEDGAEFAINPSGFGHGWIAWGKSERLGESFLPLTEPVPQPGALPEGARGWEQQFGMHLRELATGADLIYRASSVGGKRAIGALAKEVGARLAEGDPLCVPVVALGHDSYKHKEYGKIYVPEFTIARWVSVASIGTPPAPAKPVKTAAAKASPAKAAARRR
jgi:hypothetical protein